VPPLCLNTCLNVLCHLYSCMLLYPRMLSFQSCITIFHLRGSFFSLPFPNTRAITAAFARKELGVCQNLLITCNLRSVRNKK
jgi:hypothetical protein